MEAPDKERLSEQFLLGQLHEGVREVKSTVEKIQNTVATKEDVKEIKEEVKEISSRVLKLELKEATSFFWDKIRWLILAGVVATLTASFLKAFGFV